ncbi:putative bifunctional diguanylate cyclase/phosphodiesterase [Reinekea blandensis]|uniref:Sensory box/GGDEF domain/EAL domain protein n=1 Tax=Reinekea blandensis MED297 TaxID=314283 RepID=A4BED3_9GAMM|nr:bifunctional diguanylate cyclase/phosphodiesterase [Reinekea blandensis]EAR09611.1 sensory box/GGDEF domain/EAL domain protein [Reinekea blandensis MED297]
MPTKLRSAIRISLAYALYGSLWILFSDTLVGWLIHDADLISRVQTAKGWFFILVTSLLLYLLVLRSLKAFEKQNQLDPLTHLLRHYLFKQRLDSLLQRPRPDHHLMVIYTDIDAFGNINTQHGYENGDRVLSATADQLLSTYSSEVLIGRVGADQFALAFWTPKDPGNIDQQIVLLRQALQEVETGLSVPLSHTFGVALAPADGNTAKRLMSACANALARAKQHYRGSTEFHHAELSLKETQRRNLLSDLRLALTQQQMTVVYQPQFSLPDQQVTGVEALVRWQHPTKGAIPPDEFIPLAEEYGLSAEITEQVIQRCTQELAESGLLGHAIPRVSINISAVEFNSPPLFERLTHMLNQSPRLSPYLQIEITETATLANLQHSADAINRLHRSGIQFSIDDFGTGYTSLTMLKDLPVNEIKIDRSFTRDMMNQSQVAAIVTAIISMARAFDLTVVAEGIEQQDQLTLLTDMHCDEVQGYFMATPMPITELIEFIGQTA